MLSHQQWGCESRGQLRETESIEAERRATATGDEACEVVRGTARRRNDQNFRGRGNRKDELARRIETGGGRIGNDDVHCGLLPDAMPDIRGCAALRRAELRTETLELGTKECKCQGRGAASVRRHPRRARSKHLFLQ